MRCALLCTQKIARAVRVCVCRARAEGRVRPVRPSLALVCVPVRHRAIVRSPKRCDPRPARPVPSPSPCRHVDAGLRRVMLSLIQSLIAVQSSPVHSHSIIYKIQFYTLTHTVHTSSMYKYTLIFNIPHSILYKCTSVQYSDLFSYNS